jgi:hypothetical protein
MLFRDTKIIFLAAIFDHVAQTGRFIAAAEAPHVAQSALQLAHQRSECGLGSEVPGPGIARVTLRNSSPEVFDRVQFKLSQFEESRAELLALGGCRRNQLA